jgi:A/G-specific adenine glycosylase
MLQQTRVAAVIDRYEAFLRSFPSVRSLAEASEQEVLALWSGLGYYRRARMLHKAAKVVVAEHRGIMPQPASTLLLLPGIGAYTSAAIASIAHGEPVAVVDGNVERVVQRLAGWGSESTAGKTQLLRDTVHLANRLLDPARPGDFNQAMMELGATVCLPRNPKCLTCPLESFCSTRGEHPTPVRARMRLEHATYALVLRSRPESLSEVLLLQRGPDQTVMPGLWELPPLSNAHQPNAKPILTVRHSIMQVNYQVRILTLDEEHLDILALPPDRSRWVLTPDLHAIALTGLARKVLLRSRLFLLAHPTQ